MIADTAELMGVDHIGIGTDLCQNQPNSVVEWMRSGRWTKVVDFGEGSKEQPGFPVQPDWFVDNRCFPNIDQGLLNQGFSRPEIDQIMGLNWLRFFESSFGMSN
jgi:microsomal dipeptidase-like Zn-dependent dipeptidase